MSDVENVKVAVRVRPFNSREKQRNAKLIVTMKGKQTSLKNPEDPNDLKDFAFDYSYWSHDGFKEDSTGYFAPSTEKFCDQKTVYKDLGVGVLNNAWGGYNSTLFAYGQTGSGKSWSMVGYGPNKGIVPMYAEEIFKRIDEEKGKGSVTIYEVKFSMLEIYSEICRDLINPKGDKKKGLKIREHPKKGFYAENLTTSLVDSYKAIEEKMEEGTTNRTIAATNMNATSSRAHTIVAITFIQKAKNAAGQETAKTSVVNLVDLAGSERVSSTGATGDRLKEGAAINTSLSALGNVIASLAEQSEGKKVKIPYRDSVLTKLLQNALGGNCKTIMIAAISPADINFDESLSTLRYADRAKQIKTKAVVNEDPTEKLIRELKEENDRLQKMLKTGGSGGAVASGGSIEGGDSEEVKKQYEEKLRAEMEENDRELLELKQSYEDKLKAAQASSTDKANLKKDAEKNPHFINLNPDPQLSGMIIHIIKGDTCKIGKNADSVIQMQGPSIQPEHAILKKTEKGEYTIARANGDARVLVNGSFVAEQVVLSHNDRVMLGTTQLYLFKNPSKGKKKGKVAGEPDYTYDMAQEEIASNQGFDMNKEGNNNKDDYLLQEDLADMLPAVEEANSISEELDKKVKFEIALVSAKARGLVTGRTEVWVRVKNMETGLEYMWPRQKFLNRKYVMQEMFQKHEDGEDDWDLPDEKDPFTEPPDAEVQIGHVALYLESIAFLIEFRELVEVTDLKGRAVGGCNVELVPCNGKGKEYTEQDDVFVDDPKLLKGKDVHFYVKIVDAKGMPPRFTDIFGKYKFYMDTEFTETNKIGGTSNPTFDHKKMFSFKKSSKEELEYLHKGFLLIELWGKQKPPKEKLNKGKNTKQMLGAERFKKAAMASANNAAIKNVDENKAKNSMELALMKKRQQKLEQKLDHYKQISERALQALEDIIGRSHQPASAEEYQWDESDILLASSYSSEKDIRNKGQKYASSSIRSTVSSSLDTPRTDHSSNQPLHLANLNYLHNNSLYNMQHHKSPYISYNPTIRSYSNTSTPRYRPMRNHYHYHHITPNYTKHYDSTRYKRYSSPITVKKFNNYNNQNYFNNASRNDYHLTDNCYKHLKYNRTHSKYFPAYKEELESENPSATTSHLYRNADTKKYYDISSVSSHTTQNPSSINVTFPKPLLENDDMTSTGNSYSTWEKYFVKN